MVNLPLDEIKLNYIEGCMKVRLAPQETRNMQRHECVGLILVERGKVIYEHSGKRYTSDPEHILLIPNNITYHLVCVEDSDSYVLNFQIDDIPQFKQIACVNMSGKQNFLSSAARMEVLWTFKKPAYKLRCMAGLYEMLARISDIENTPYAPDSQFEQIRASVEYIETHWADPELTNEVAASKSNISTVYFRRLFTNKHGVSPMKYVKLKRIEKAQELLRGQYSSVGSVSRAVGFNSIYHFSRAFKNATGDTPSAYTQNSQKNV